MGTAYGQSVNAAVIILTDHEIGFDNDVIVLSPTQSLDLSSLNSTAPVNSTQTIGTLTIDLTQEVTFVANANDIIILKNIELPTVSVEITDKTTISAPQEWDNTILPPIEIPTTGNIPSGFQTPNSVIQIGSPDVVLIFDKTVTIILEGVTGQTAYKLPGTDNWVLISGCTGTYDSPDDPSVNGECSISNGVNTKILTYHFTEFAELEEEETVETTVAESSTSSNTSGASHTASRGGSSSFGVISNPSTTLKVIPPWFTNVVVWWHNDQLNDQEFKNVMTYLLDNDIIPTDTLKQNNPLVDLAPSTKNLFYLWSNDKLSESIIINLIQYYRGLSVW